MLVVGLVLAFLTLVVWAFGLHVSFTSEGGAIGMVPVLAYAVAVPIFGVLTALVLRVALHWHMPSWLLLIGFPVAVAAVGWTIVIAGRMGERAHRRAPQQSH